MSKIAQLQKALQWNVKFVVTGHGVMYEYCTLLFARLLFGLLLLSTQFAQAIPLITNWWIWGTTATSTITRSIMNHKPLDAFLIFFDFAQYDNISLESARCRLGSPVPANGCGLGLMVLDAMSLSTPIDPGQSLVVFPFHLIGSAALCSVASRFCFTTVCLFDTLLEGTTLLTAVSQVPAPAPVFICAWIPGSRGSERANGSLYFVSPVLTSGDTLPVL